MSLLKFTPEVSGVSNEQKKKTMAMKEDKRIFVGMFGVTKSWTRCVQRKTALLLKQVK